MLLSSLALIFQMRWKITVAEEALERIFYRLSQKEENVHAIDYSQLSYHGSHYTNIIRAGAALY